MDYHHQTVYHLCFIFVLSDEGWKGGDKHWGIYYQGTSTRLGKKKISTDSFWSKS